ncbi:hypothetical protein Q7P37_003182 [Cladosporium fusiforme]
MSEQRSWDQRSADAQLDPDAITLEQLQSFGDAALPVSSADSQAAGVALPSSRQSSSQHSQALENRHSPGVELQSAGARLDGVDTPNTSLEQLQRFDIAAQAPSNVSFRTPSRRHSSTQILPLPVSGHSSRQGPEPSVARPGRSDASSSYNSTWCAVSLSGVRPATISSPHASVAAVSRISLSDDNSLKHLETADVPAAAKIVLPSSSILSNDEIEPGITTPKTNASSLEQLNQLDPISPHELPLPGSSDSEDEGGHSIASFPSALQSKPDNQMPFADTENVNPVFPAIRNYWRQIKPLEEFLPHLENISPFMGRHQDAGRLTSIDLFPGPTAPHVGKVYNMSSEVDHEGLTKTLKSLRSVQDASVTHRLIVVEDLCPRLIEALGKVFNLDPEFFAEHLNRSGYNGEDYDANPPTRWNTAHTAKDHASTTWCRPVYQNSRLTAWLQDPGSLLNKRGGSASGTSSITWRDAAYDAADAMNTRAKEHRLRVNTNIFRQSWTMSAKPFERDDSDRSAVGLITENQSLDQKRSELVPTAWQERVSFCRIDRYINSPVFMCEHPTPHHVGASSLNFLGIILLDPLPTITDVQTPLYGRNPSSSSNSATKKTEIEMALPMVPRLSVDSPANKYEANARQVHRLKKSFTKLSSTFSVMTSDSSGDPILTLLRVVERDTQAFFRSVELVLDDISHDSLDDFHMTHRLSEWRRMMAEFEIEVPQIALRLERFVDIVYGGSPDRVLPNDVEDLLHAVRQGAERTSARLSDAYADLRADMQFTESRRSIEENRTVTRLTELAFIFIPLSFCSSLFSMSIHELEDGVPLWIYIVTALMMMALAYSVRLLVESQFSAKITRRWLERFWEHNGIKRSDLGTVPMLTVLRFTVQEIWNSTVRKYLIATAASVLWVITVGVPVVFMWTFTDMGNSFKIAITLLLLLSVLATVSQRFGLRLVRPFLQQRRTARAEMLFSTDDNDGGNPQR